MSQQPLSLNGPPPPVVSRGRHRVRGQTDSGVFVTTAERPALAVRTNAVPRAVPRILKRSSIDPLPRSAIYASPTASPAPRQVRARKEQARNIMSV